jgi:hypothetical protein
MYKSYVTYLQHISYNWLQYGHKYIHTYIHTRCGYEVPGMILVQAYLYTYTAHCEGVIFKVVSLSSYALNPTMLLLLETFLELLLWNSFQCRRHIF